VPDPRIVILGGGPAGLGGAFRLAGKGGARVILVERREAVGGNAGSFECGGQRVDYGSHRLHPACDSTILDDIRSMLGDDLVTRPRHGRIRLLGEWVHFPLRPLDLALRLDRRFAAGVLRDMLLRLPGRDGTDEDTFADVLRSRLGRTICEHFYFPYARKIWGLEPEELSAVQAHRRVAANSFGKLVRKVLGRLPGVPPVGFQHYYYPRSGYGGISEAYAREAVSRGAELLLGWEVAGLERPETPGGEWRVTARRDDETRTMEADHVWSTIPLTALARLVTPAAPPAVLEAADAMRFRSMILVYLTLDVDRFSEYDAHYFPGPEIAITRLSEPKNYADLAEPRGRTTLCAELPCSPADDWWRLDDRELGRRVGEQMERVGLPLPVEPASITTRRLGQAYPIYDLGYEPPFDTLDEWVDGLPGLITYGRQGLFAHDNTHHALYMGYRAADCFGPDGFDAERWARYREEFETHVVED